MAKKSKERRDKRSLSAAKGKPRRYLKLDTVIDYRDIDGLGRFVSDRGKLRSRRVTGASRRQQRLIARAVKRSRELALMPYVTEGDDRPERRRGGRDRDRDR